MTDQTEPQRIGILSIFKSVLSSFFGVQSAKNRERDFQYGKPIHYIIVGLVITLMFILTVWSVVRLVLYLAGV
jgi:diacylglycerol kinase